MPPQIREQMIRLGAENKRLKEQYEREMSHVTETKDEMNDTIKKLMDEKNELNKRIAELEQVKVGITFWGILIVNLTFVI